MIITRVVSGVVQPVVRTVGGVGYGPDGIIDGNFDDGAAWTPGLGWTIEDGVATRAAVASSAGLSQPYPFIAGWRYLVVYTITDLTAPMFVAQFTGGSTRTGTSRTANGTYSETLTANTGNNSFRIFAGSNAAAVIDSVSVRRII